MGESWRIGVDVQERTSLVTAGVFGLVRNPIFSAMCVASIGLAPGAEPLVAAGFVLLLSASSSRCGWSRSPTCVGARPRLPALHR